LKEGLKGKKLEGNFKEFDIFKVDQIKEKNYFKN